MTTVQRELNNVTVYKVVGAFNLFNENGVSNRKLIEQMVVDKIMEDDSLSGNGDTQVNIILENEELTISCKYSFLNLENIGEKINFYQKELLAMTKSDYILDFDQDVAIYIDKENKAHSMEELLNEIPKNLKEAANEVLKEIKHLESLILN